MPGREFRRTTPGPAAVLITDAVAWIGGILFAVWCRYDFTLFPSVIPGAVAIGLLGAGAQAVAGDVVYLYRRRHEFGTFDEVRAVVGAAMATVAALVAINLVLPSRAVPASTPVIGGFFALVLMLGRRYVYRLRRESRLRPHMGTPVLLFGAGAAGHDLARAILRDPTSKYFPVGMLDDDPDKYHLRVYGVPMLGGRADIRRAMAKTGARTIIFSVARADADLIRDIQNLAREAGAALKIVPSIRELLSGRARVADIRDVEVSDLLGRRQVETDLGPIAEYLAGKRVLVTGAGGSIGSELCRQLHRFKPAELMMLDRDESALHAVQLSIRGQAIMDDPELILADLRDVDAMREVFRTREPQVVFHAAALKHLPLLENHPAEAVKTNIWGTLTVLDLAERVEKFVNISTDKAVNPSNVLGYSKRISERLTAEAAMRHDGTFLNVRFGNVLGSRGSVLTTFTAQAANGGPITVTDPEVTRYFMTVQEAVQLVIQAAAVGQDGEVLVLDMGRPIRIADVARQLAEQAEEPVAIVYTGLRPGEKLHEERLGPIELDIRPHHPLISQVAVPPLSPDLARLIDPTMKADDLIAHLAWLCQADAKRASLVADAA
jgi:FlaA1/EpsC-like NDP-sugar epimerase